VQAARVKASTPTAAIQDFLTMMETLGVSPLVQRRLATCSLGIMRQ
jgi:hypothetical protein